MSDDATDQATRAECLAELAELELEKRKVFGLALAWVKARHYQAGSGSSSDCWHTEEDISPRARHALDMATVACCERVVRIMNSDLPRDQRLDG